MTYSERPAFDVVVTVGLILLCLCAVPLAVEAQTPTIEKVLDLSQADTVDWSPEIRRLGGDTKSLDPKKSRLTIGVFWASWCGPCRKEFAQLRKLVEDFSDSGFQVIGINVEESPKKARAFLKNNPANFPIYLDRNRDIHAQFDDAEFYVLPAGFVISDSNLVGSFQGAREFDRQSVRNVIKAKLSN